MSFEFIPTTENLRQEELIVQLADRLKLIDSYSKTLFEHIEIKLNDVNQKLNDINRRSDVCSHKICQLKDEKKAITLYSHSKFPSREIKIKEFYESFILNDKLPGQIVSENKKINATHIPYDDDSRMKSQFYIYDKHINRPSIPEYLTESHIPWKQISSLSSLLLFNSSENAYTFSRTNFNKNGLTRSRKAKSTDDSEDGSSQRNESRNEPQENDDFQLTFHQAPQILNDLPAELPSLPGIADEFHFKDSGEIDSVDVSQLNLPDLAQLTKIAFAPPSNTAQPIDSELTNVNFALPTLPISENGIVTPPLVPPPPPPPPPPLLDEVEPRPVSQNNGNSDKPAVPQIKTISSDNNRASLLESIRAAGGKPKRKTIKELKHDEKLKKKDSEEANNRSNLSGSPSTGMDMMAELRKRLESRRSGISNDPINKPNEHSIGARTGLANPYSAMANVSAMIPPPANAAISEDELEEDNNFEDWD